MNSIYIAAIIASFVLVIPIVPFLAAPASTILHGVVPNLPAILNSMEPSAIPGWWFSDSFLACPDGLLATWALCLAVSLLMALSSAAGRRADDGGALGRAHIKEGAEALRGSTIWDGRHSPKARGFVYGFTRGRYLFEPERFVLLDGSTGSGKSRFCLIPSIDLLTYGNDSNGSRPNGILVSDAKDEMLELTGEELERRGYNVLLLDTQHPMRGHRYNPLQLLINYADVGLMEEVEQAADTISAVIIPNEKGEGTTHWVESGRALLSAAILLVVLSKDCPKDAKHLATVYEVICRGTEGEGKEPAEPLKAFFARCQRDIPLAPAPRSFSPVVAMSYAASSRQ
ncbi:MAG: hypothetical protein DUD39_11470 [Coriobacteriaceae bacterium]|nr:MAG: hypothetical protein DUD39_11470 [Coriobacteriaceae bacterium]